MGSCYPSGNVEEHFLATARGKRVRPQVELSGWILELPVTPRGHPKGKIHDPWSQRVFVRLGSLTGVRQQPRRPVPACDSGVRKSLQSAEKDLGIFSGPRPLGRGGQLPLGPRAQLCPHLALLPLLMCLAAPGAPGLPAIWAAQRRAHCQGSASIDL